MSAQCRFRGVAARRVVGAVYSYWARAEERRGLKREHRFYTILEVLQCEGGSNMA